MSTPFPGFSDSETYSRLPDSLFRLLPGLDVDEIKVTLYVLWRIQHMEGALLALERSDMLSDAGLMSGLDAAGLDSGLEKAVSRGILLRVESSGGGIYLPNSPRGRANFEALKNGQMDAAARFPSSPPRDVPNIFKLYEENIGAMTALMADILREAEKEYPAAWVHEAFTIAVTRNKRSWKYIEAILKRWKSEGRDERETQQNTQPGSERYTRSQFSEYFDEE